MGGKIGGRQGPIAVIPLVQHRLRPDAPPVEGAMDPLDLILDGPPLVSAAADPPKKKRCDRSVGDLLERAEQQREVLKRARLCKKMKALERRACHAAAEKGVIESAWNSTQLRLGDLGDAQRRV